MNKQDEDNVLHVAIKQYGVKSQVDVAIEEMAELTQALIKNRRYPEDEEIRKNVREEMADVSIMLDQLKIIFGDFRFERHKKLERLLHRVMQQRDDERDRRKQIAEAGDDMQGAKYIRYVASLGLCSTKRCSSCIYRDHSSMRCLNPNSKKYTGIVSTGECCPEYDSEDDIQ